MELETRTLEVCGIPITARYEVRWYKPSNPTRQAIVKAVWIGDCPEELIEHLNDGFIENIAATIENILDDETPMRKNEAAEYAEDHDRTEARAINAERGIA